VFRTLRPSRVTMMLAAAAAGIALAGGGVAAAATTSAPHHLTMSHSPEIPGAAVRAPTGTPGAPGQFRPGPAPTGSPGAPGQVPAGSAAGSGFGR
jgi:hypothetical protein